jgi:ATP-binding cassette, subfamily B, bacterial PglK
MNKFLFLLGDKKIFFFFMMPAFLMASLLDVIGISILAPYIGVLVGSSDLDSIPLIATFFDYFQLNLKSEEFRTSFGLIILVIFSVKALVTLFINKRIINFSFIVATDLRLKLFKSYQSLPYVEFCKENQSKYIHNIFSVVQSFSQGALLPVLKLISETIILLAILTLLWVVNSSIFYALLAIFTVTMIIFQMSVGYKSGPLGRQTNIYSKKIMQLVKEAVTGFKFVRVMKIDEYFFTKLKGCSQQYAKSNSSYYFLSIIPRYVIELVLVFCIVALSYFATVNDELSTTLFIFAASALRLQPSVSTMVHSYNSILNSKNSIDLLYKDLKLEDILSSKSSFHDDVDFLIKFSNVSYKYPNSNKEALLDINLTIKSGDVIGLVGESGSGKSTLLYLLIGLLQPSNGSIQRTKEWTEEIMYTPQDVFLIDDTLENNIAIGCEKIDHDKILSSLESASLADLDQILNQTIGDEGELLSGGQRQRVGLARIFYFDKNIIILDEPTSSLDSKTEKIILDSLQKLKSQGKTIVIVSHNKAPLNICNKIFSLECGMIENTLEF